MSRFYLEVELVQVKSTVNADQVGELDSVKTASMALVLCFPALKEAIGSVSVSRKQLVGGMTVIL